VEASAAQLSLGFRGDVKKGGLDADGAVSLQGFSMARLLVSSESLAKSRVEIRGREAHYVARVLRMRVGERMVLFDGAGCEADAVVGDVTARAVVLDVVGRREVRDENPLDLTVVQATLTGDKAAWLVEKLTEVGVSRVVFFPGERSVRVRVAVPRLVRIAEAASRQSGRASLPRIDEAESLGAAIDDAQLGPSCALRIFGRPDVTSDALTLREVVGRVPNEKADNLTRIRAALAIGPESGFTALEEDLLCARRFDGVRLGPRTLRAESAGLIFASILLYRLGDLR
jgi:16S rRNA (uracil1498-N3)-methyltransferase